MCKGGSRTTTTSGIQEGHVASEQELGTDQWQRGYSRADPEARAASNEALARARRLAEREQIIPGRQIAEFSPWQTAALEEGNRFGQATQPYQTMSDAMMERGRQAVSLNPLDVDRYYNPYAASAFARLNQNLGIGSTKLRSANSAAMGGVGGDRGAVLEALSFGQDQMARGQLGAQFYDRALQTAQQQQGAQYGADTANRENYWNAARNYLQAYVLGQGARGTAGQAVTQRNQAVSDADYQRQREQMEEPWRRQQMLTEMITRNAPILGQETGSMGELRSRGRTFQDTSQRSHQTQTEESQQDTMSQIAGLAMAGLGLAMGNPMMAMQGMSGLSGGQMGNSGWSSLFGGGQTSNGYNTSQTGGGNPFPTPFGGYPGSSYATFARGGRINPWVPRKAYGGPLYSEEDYSPMDEALDASERERLIAPPARDFDSRWPAPGQINSGADVMGNPRAAQRQFRDAFAPLAPPAPTRSVARPPASPEPPLWEGPASIAAPRAVSPYAPPSRSPGRESAIEYPEPPTYEQPERRKRNWADFLFRAGIATLAASGDTDSRGIPKSSVSKIGKGLLTADAGDRTERAAELKELEAKNYNLDRLDQAKMRRLQLQTQRQNALDSADERRLSRESLDAWRESQSGLNIRKQEELERHRRVDEARKSYIAQKRDQMLQSRKVMSLDVIELEATKRADLWEEREIRKTQAGMGTDMSSEQLREGRARVLRETKEAMLEARRQALEQMRTPVGQ